MRTAFINQLIKEAAVNEKIFLLVGDLGFSVVEPFAKKFPDRYINVGIAEQNMTGLAAGLAMEGFKVFTYSIANFSTLRALEQIRNDVCYHNLDVHIVSIGAGYAYGSLGASHHATEEMGIMRAIPNMEVCCPSDPVEAKKITTLLCRDYKGPAYLRLGKSREKIVHTEDIETFKLGDILKVLEGEETAIFGTGNIVEYAKTEILRKKNNYSLYSFPFLSSIELNQLESIVKKYNKIITIEEHQKNCGFGSLILEKVNDLVEEKKLETFPTIKRIAIDNKFTPIAGTQQYLRAYSHLKI